MVDRVLTHNREYKLPMSRELHIKDIIRFYDNIRRDYNPFSRYTLELVNNETGAYIEFFGKTHYIKMSPLTFTGDATQRLQEIDLLDKEPYHSSGSDLRHNWSKEAEGIQLKNLEELSVDFARIEKSGMVLSVGSWDFPLPPAYASLKLYFNNEEKNCIIKTYTFTEKAGFRLERAVYRLLKSLEPSGLLASA